MSFYIDATTPDMQGFDPAAQGSPLPPVGVYAGIQLQVVDGKQGETKAREPKFDVTFEAMSGAIAGTQFTLTYNTGNRNPDTAKWAIQDVIRLLYGITGESYVGRRIEFDSKMYYRPFIATLTVSEKMGNDNGKQTLFKNGKLTGIKPMSSQQPQQPAQAPVGYPQQPQQPVGQPQAASTATPPWQAR